MGIQLVKNKCIGGTISNPISSARSLVINDLAPPVSGNDMGEFKRFVCIMVYMYIYIYM